MPAKVDAQALAKALALVIEQQEQPRFASVDEALDGFGVWLRGRGRSKRTCYMYPAHIRGLQTKHGLDLLNLNENVIIMWTAKALETCKGSTVTQYQSVLRAWCKYTGQDDAMRDIEPPRVDTEAHETRQLPPLAVRETFRDAMRPSKHNHSRKANDFRRDGLVWDLMYGAAFRVSEAVSFELPDLLVKERGGFRVWDATKDDIPTHVLVRAEKTKKHRSGKVPLLPALGRAIANYVRLHREGPKNPDYKSRLFLIRRNPAAELEPLTPEAFRQRLARLAHLMGPDYAACARTHNGRRASITGLLKRGMPEHIIIRISRHKTTKELAPYVRPTVDDVDAIFKRVTSRRERD